MSGAGLFAGSALVAAPAASAAPGCAGLVTEAQVSPPAGYHQVVNAVMKVSNDEDSGMVGYWALDNYNKHIQVWANSTDTNFYVAATYHGTWHTFAKALSPDTGTAEPANGTGSMAGGYTATLSGSMLATPAEPTHGTVGKYHFGGTQSDIMLGTYGNGQTGAPTPTDWLSFYFGDSTISTFAFTNGGNGWGWRYSGNSTDGPWCNTGLGTSGDIVTH